MELLAQDPDT